jgi:hypothetical protein
MKSTLLWVVTPYSSEESQRFGGTYYLHLQVRRVSQARNQQDAGDEPHAGLPTSGVPELFMATLSNAVPAFMIILLYLAFE